MMHRKELVVICVAIVGLCTLYAATPTVEPSQSGDPPPVVPLSTGKSERGTSYNNERFRAVAPPPPAGKDRLLAREDAAVASYQGMPSTSLCSGGVDAYFEYFSTLVESHLGSELIEAVYDRDALGELARAAAAGTLGDEDRFLWHINKLRSPPVDPIPFSSPATMLRLLKRLVSVGIGRVHRDVEVATMFAHACSSPPAFAVFRRALLRVVESYVNYFFTVLQLTIDASSTPVRETLSKVQLQTCEPHGEDVLAFIMTAVHHDTTVGEITELLGKEAVDLAAFIESQRQNVRNEVLAKGRVFSSGNHVLAMFPLEYDAESYGGQRPVNGKFWNMIRPTASCTSLVRLCEKPDGCRLLCNAEYLLHAGLQSKQHNHNGGVYHHRMAGFGSNNEYDWEMSLVKMFNRGAKSASRSIPAPREQQDGGAVHSIGWFTVFDCTLGSGNRQWSPPAALTEQPIGFGYASKCLDAKSSATAYGFADVKRVLQSSEVAQKEGRQHDAITRRKVSPSTIAAVVSSDSEQPAHHSWNTRRSPGSPRVRLFDALSVLKVDVEGYEFNAMPEWARDELRNLGETSGSADALAKGSATRAKGSSWLIDFEHAIHQYFSVSLLSMEFHRSGHKYPHGANLRGAQRSHYTLLHIYSLGFVMAGQEKNHQDNCCYELVWVHYRHFIRSEIWMAVGDSL